jgi:biopolymer transport protein ExbD
VTPEFPVVIKGDRTAQYGRIMEVLDICARLQITQLGLVSERQAPSR